MFSSRNKKNLDTFWLKKCLIKSCERPRSDCEDVQCDQGLRCQTVCVKESMDTIELSIEIYFSHNSANLICRVTDISKYFRESLGLPDNKKSTLLCLDKTLRMHRRNLNMCILHMC